MLNHTTANHSVRTEYSVSSGCWCWYCGCGDVWELSATTTCSCGFKVQVGKIWLWVKMPKPKSLRLKGTTDGGWHTKLGWGRLSLVSWEMLRHHTNGKCFKITESTRSSLSPLLDLHGGDLPQERQVFINGSSVPIRPLKITLSIWVISATPSINGSPSSFVIILIACRVQLWDERRVTWSGFRGDINSLWTWNITLTNYNHCLSHAKVEHPASRRVWHRLTKAKDRTEQEPDSSTSSLGRVPIPSMGKWR